MSAQQVEVYPVNLFLLPRDDYLHHTSHGGDLLYDSALSHYPHPRQKEAAQSSGEVSL